MSLSGLREDTPEEVVRRFVTGRRTAKRAAGGAGLAGLPPQVPDGGWMRRLLGPLHVTGVFWYRFHCWGVRALPRWGIAPAVLSFTIFFFLALRRIRRAVASNLEALLGRCGAFERQRRVWRTLWSYAWCETEHYEHLVTKRKVKVKIEDAARATSRGTGEGFVLVTAHVGQWEAGSMVAPSFEHRRVHVVREAELDPQAQEFVERQFAESCPAGVTVHFVRRGPDLSWKLLRALRQGEVVALQGDRPYAGGRTMRATLCGRPVEFPLGPVALARAAGVDLLPVFIFRDGRSHARVVFRPPIPVARDGEAEEDSAAAIGRVAAEIEWAIRQHPEQWFCFGQMWP